MTTLIQFVLVGIVLGLAVECLAVLARAEPGHQKRHYLTAGLLGAGGALAGIPLLMLMDLARGGPGEMSSELLRPGTAQGPAILLVCFWIVWKHLSSLHRWVFFGTMGSLLAMVVTWLLVQATA